MSAEGITVSIEAWPGSAWACTVMSLDSDLASVQVAKGSPDVPQVFKQLPGLSNALVKVLGEVRVQRVQGFGVIQPICVQNELTDLLEKFFRPTLEKGDDFGLRVRFLAYSPSVGCHLSVVRSLA